MSLAPSRSAPAERSRRKNRTSWPRAFIALATGRSVVTCPVPAPSSQANSIFATAIRVPEKEKPAGRRASSVAAGALLDYALHARARVDRGRLESLSETRRRGDLRQVRRRRDEARRQIEITRERRLPDPDELLDAARDERYRAVRDGDVDARRERVRRRVLTGRGRRNVDRRVVGSADAYGGSRGHHA